MQVSALRSAQCLGRLPQELRQSLHARYPDDVNVIVAAERLDEGEVNLQSDVTLLFFVYGQEAQDHAVGVPEGEKGCHRDATPDQERASPCTGEGTSSRNRRREGWTRPTVHQECVQGQPPTPVLHRCWGDRLCKCRWRWGREHAVPSYWDCLVKTKNTKPQTCSVRVLQQVSFPLPKKFSEKCRPPLPNTESAGKSPTTPSPPGLLESACIRGAPPPTPGKGGADSHVHQFGRLVHPHGEAILTLRGHQQLLHRGSHRLHSKKAKWGD